MGFLVFLAVMVIAFFIILRVLKEMEIPTKVRTLVVTVWAIILLSGIVGNSLRVIDPGEIGVITTFGSVSSTPIGNGLHFVSPISGVEIMDARTQAYTMSSVGKDGDSNQEDAISAQASDGLMMDIELTVQYRILPSDAPTIFQELGHDYVTKVVRPEVRSAIRDQATRFISSDMYNEKRTEFERQIFETLVKGFKTRGLICEKVLLRNVQPPKEVLYAINEKIQADQAAQKMEFVLAKERQEAERKRIEAQGIADFQKIVSQGITEQMLRWKGIEATLELAKSPNAKSVIMGASKDGLPVILGQ